MLNPSSAQALLVFCPWRPFLSLTTVFRFLIIAMVLSVSLFFRLTDCLQFYLFLIYAILLDQMFRLPRTWVFQCFIFSAGKHFLSIYLSLLFDCSCLFSIFLLEDLSLHSVELMIEIGKCSCSWLDMCLNIVTVNQVGICSLECLF